LLLFINLKLLEYESIKFYILNYVNQFTIVHIIRVLPKSGDVTITIVSTSNPKKIRWELTDREGARISGYSAPMGFSIPTDIILTKID